MAWVYLLAAGLLEIVWATALKFSDGFTRVGPSALGAITAATSFFLLALALRSLPIGTAYAIWVGIGTSGVVLFGMLALDEAIDPLRLGCLALILIGTLGLKWLEG